MSRPLATPPPAPATSDASARRNWARDVILAVVCAVVVGFYGWRSAQEPSELGAEQASDAYYNLLIQGFSRGQLHLAVETPPDLLRLADPLDPQANFPFRKHPYEERRLHDATLYAGKIHLYFGVTPALLLFWPYHVVTGHYVSHQMAVAGFGSLGFLLAAGLLRAIWLRYFAALPVGIVAGGVLALGMANSIPAMLSRPDVWEVPISCGYALVMLTFALLWRAVHEPAARLRWTVAASVAYGLAVGARPSLLTGAAIVLLPVWWSWHDALPGTGRRRSLRHGLMAAVIPMALLGLGLAAYNQLRFGSPLEFGQNHQLAADRQAAVQHFSGRYLVFNFRLYFLQVIEWGRTFPYVTDAAMPAMPEGHGDVASPYGILINTPVTLFALALPWAWRRGRSAERRPLWRFAGVVAGYFGLVALTLCLFYGTCVRYQVEFHPALTLLACIAALALAEAWRAKRGFARALGVVGTGALVYSMLFSALRTFEGTGQRWHSRGFALDRKGDRVGALAAYQQALRYRPNLIEAHFGAALDYDALGNPAAAVAHYEEIIRREPGHARARNNLGNALQKLGRFTDAIVQYQAALAGDPDFLEAHVNLGLAGLGARQPELAAQHFGRAVQLRPDFPEAQYYLGVALRNLGRSAEARVHYEAARRLKPELPEMEW